MEKWQGKNGSKDKLKGWGKKIGRSSRITHYALRTTLHALLCLCCGFGLHAAEPKELADYPNELTRDGDLIILPDQGIVYVASDFHAHWTDFNQWLEQTQLIERLKAGEDVYGLILGDVVDHKPGDPIVELFGDTRIVNKITQLQAELDEKGKRLIYLRGNHELASAETYGMLKQHGLNDHNRANLIEKLYNGPQGAYYRQFNFIERMNDEQHRYLTRLPTVVIGKNGFVGIHAGTSRTAKNLAALARPYRKILDELLWDRPAIAKVGGYTPAQTADFLRRIGGSVLTVGHTPLGYFGKENVKDGIARHGQHQLIFSTGYGAPPGVRSYLAIDLAKKYTSVAELKYGVEIYPLYP
jgi:hypothetical protein